MFHKYEPFLKEIKCTFHLGNELITTNKERLHEENENYQLLPVSALLQAVQKENR
jgi:hypothetical protein